MRMYRRRNKCGGEGTKKIVAGKFLVKKHGGKPRNSLPQRKREALFMNSVLK